MLYEPPPSRRRRLVIRLAVGVAVVATLVVAGVKMRSGPGKVEASSPPAQGKGDAKGDPKGDKKDKPPASVAVRPIEVGAISAYTTATANLVAEDEVKVVAENEGKIVELK